MNARIPFSQLEFFNEAEVGRGNSGIVRKATFDGETVVVKILSRNDKQAIREWDNEVQILQSLNNPHIVRYIGSGYDDRGFPMIVMEFGGDPFIPFFNRQLAEKTLTLRDVHNYILQLAETIQYLHTRNISHGDLKWENVLIDSNGVIKLCDFGFSSIFRTSPNDPLGVNDEKCKGNIMTLAPEYFISYFRHATNDVYSLGMMILWLFIRKFPYSGIPLRGLNSTEIMQAVIDRQLVLDIPNNLQNTYYYRLITACTFVPNEWNLKYSDIVRSRPSIDDVCASLREHLNM